ncbi:hypothetical protein GIB67_005564 [Kingdonia uniflora]|uniref:Uncharacterized protein n=1 Tax=Kingdonia uniflora TaxID=39325 RepID=A0A7J7NIA0_9MAGN|nr:hypothetical protein GIB67_005564 [Kingdonia uniflora]
MEENGEIRPWDEMIPEALELIFNELSLQEKLNVIPIVCKPWGKVVAERVWKDIDIIEWGKFRNHDDRDRMLQMLINRSTSSLRKLCAYEISGNLMFSFIADQLIQRVYLHFIFTSAGNLETLWLPRGQMTTSIVEQVAWKLSTVTNMDLSYCEILAPALEAIGRNCKSLKELHRVMYPPSYGIYGNSEEETRVIATTMTKLRHLELSYMFLSSECAHEILSSCLELEFFDVRGCYEADFDEGLLKEKYSKISILRTPPRIIYQQVASTSQPRFYEDIDWEFSSR